MTDHTILERDHGRGVISTSAYLEHQAASIRRPLIWLGTMRT